jgi:hypothetical protein
VLISTMFAFISPGFKAPVSLRHCQIREHLLVVESHAWDVSKTKLYQMLEYHIFLIYLTIASWERALC